MWTLTFILSFIIASIVAACSGDYSGIKTIAQFVMNGAFIILIIYLIAFKPLLLGVFCVVFLIYVFYDSHKKAKK